MIYFQIEISILIILGGFLKYFALFITFLLFLSCSNGKTGYYVAIWPPEESFAESGDVVRVISKSDTREIYVIQNSEDRNQREEVPKYSGRFFKNKKEAMLFSEKYVSYANLFGFSEKILVLKVADQNDAPKARGQRRAVREYRLRSSQPVKIIDKIIAENNESDKKAFYLVLTEDGFEGLAPENALTLYQVGSNTSDGENEKVFTDVFFNSRWYPSSYLDALKSEQVVIEKLDTGEGFFPDMENKKIVLHTAENRIEFVYEDIRAAEKNSYFFTDTPVEVVFYSQDRIFVRYSYNGTDYSDFYSTLDNPISYYIKNESKRRANEITSFLKPGQFFTSEFFGTIKFDKKGKFQWENYINLVPDVIPFGYGQTGKLETGYFTDKALEKEYDGVIAFVFDRTGGKLFFAYTATDGGVRLTHLPINNSSAFAESRTVRSIPSKDSNVFFFRQDYLTSGEPE